MKIEKIDRETKNSKIEHLLPIAKAGLSLGLTTALIKAGVIDYDSMLNWESMSETISNMNITNLPGIIDIDTAYELVKTGITTFGMNTIMIASKGFEFTKEALKPIVESEKVQNNTTILKIKELFKGKDNDKETKKPKALVNLAQNGLSLGFKAYMIASGKIDYNSVYDLTQLPHRFAKIAQIAEKIDLNELKMGIETLKILPQFISERRQEKKDDLPLIPRVSFKKILASISKKFPVTTRISDLAYIRNIGPTRNNSKHIEPVSPEMGDR